MAIQKLCPYTATELGAEGEINREHVTPIAIGAPECFYVQSHKEFNSRWNDEIDGPFSNDECIRFLAMANNVESRSGDVVSRVSGKVSETADDITLEFSRGGLDVYFKQPVSKRTNAYTVKGYGDKAAREADKLILNLQKKGHIVERGEHISIQKPTISASLSMNTELAFKQLIKTAYLYTVWCLGDDAIVTENSQQYLDAMSGGKITSTNLVLSNSLQGFHQFTLLVIDGTAYCEVDLFGVLRGIFVTNLRQSVDIFEAFSHRLKEERAHRGH